MKKKVMRAVQVVLVAALLAALFVIGRQAYDGWKNRQDSEEAARLAGLAGDGEEPAAPEDGGEEVPVLPEEAQDLASIDLTALQEVNPDVAGWIAIPGTKISYPLLWGEDNQEYLNTTWKGESSRSGSIFLESRNSPDLSDFHTIIYGHRMRNDSMFGSLKYYRDQAYWEAHPNVYVVMDSGRIRRYEIFSAHQVDVKGVVYRLNIPEEGLEEEFLQSCLEDSAIETGIIPEVTDQFLTLSTCTGTGYSRRWAIHAVFRDEYLV